MEEHGEIIQVHLGRTGIEMMNACWQWYCQEHQISLDGKLRNPHCESNNFLGATKESKLIPRVVVIDTDPFAIDAVRTGPFQNLFHPSWIISGREDASNNFARGFNTLGNEMIVRITDSIRKMAETCSNLQGFLIFRSMGGGTGGGLGSLLLRRLSKEYKKKLKVDFEIFPSAILSPNIVEPYNCALATHSSLDFADCSFILDNEALIDICTNNLSINSPTYTHLNQIVGKVLASITACFRYKTVTEVTLQDICTTLVPYPRIHHPLISQVPFVSLENSRRDQLDTKQLTLNCFESKNQIVNCCPKSGKYMSGILLYRGDVTPTDVNQSIDQIKQNKRIRFVKTGVKDFKICINDRPPSHVPEGDLAPSNRSVTMLASNTSIRSSWCHLMMKFEQMFSRAAFVHHYIQEGLDKDIIENAMENVRTLIHDYALLEEM